MPNTENKYANEPDIWKKLPSIFSFLKYFKLAWAQLVFFFKVKISLSNLYMWQPLKQHKKIITEVETILNIQRVFL